MNSIVLEGGGRERRLWYRPGTSDEMVIRQVFAAQHYGLTKLARYGDIQAFLGRLRSAGVRPLVVDAGANIGASAAYFAMMYPDARVVAVEPEPGNFAVLRRNTEGLEVRCVAAALSGQPGQTRVVDPGAGEWGYRTDPAGTGPEVPSVTVPQLLREHGGSGFATFLVKIDIEGGEREVFEADTGWVEQIPVLVIELHDWLLPGQGTARPFLRCVAGRDRDFVLAGENVFSVNNRLAAG